MTVAIELLAYGGDGGPGIGAVALVIGGIVLLGLVGLMLTSGRRG